MLQFVVCYRLLISLSLLCDHRRRITDRPVKFVSYSYLLKTNRAYLVNLAMLGVNND